MVASVAVGGLFDGLKPAAVRLADLEEGQDGGGRRSGQISNSPAASVSDDSLARRHRQPRSRSNMPSRCPAALPGRAHSVKLSNYPRKRVGAPIQASGESGEGL